MHRARLAVLLLATLALACDRAGSEPAPAPAVAPADAPAVAIAPLDAAATGLREWFEANAGKPRFVTILSPT